VADDDDRDAQLGVDPAEQVEHVAGGLGVEGAGGLVGKQQSGRGRERAGDTDSLFLPARELVGVLARLVGQPHELEQLGDPRLPALLRPARHPQRVGDVPGDGARVEQVELLEDETDAGPRGP